MNLTIPALSRIAEIEARFGSPPPAPEQPPEAAPSFEGVLSDVDDGPPTEAPIEAAASEEFELFSDVMRTASMPTAGAWPNWATQLGLPHPGVRRLEPTLAGPSTVLGGPSPMFTGPSTVLGTGPVPSHVPFADRFNASGAAHGVPATLLAAVGFVESRYQPDAVSPDGAQGVMQLMPFVSEELGVDATIPAEAIDGAARLLAQHRERFGSWELALAAYFSGAGAVSRAGNVPPTPRSQRYVDDVLARMEQL